MKRINNYWIALAIAVSLPACSTHQTPITLQPIGPAPQEGFTSNSQGWLMVYSDWAADATHNRHSSYKVVSEDGKVSQQIRNSADMFDSGPTRVALPAGTYQVTARAAHSGRVTVPVQIGVGRTTYVYLDGYKHLDGSAVGKTNLVVLPNIGIVGWAAGGAVN
jgi:hypothetical protein